MIIQKIKDFWNLHFADKTETSTIPSIGIMSIPSNPSSSTHPVYSNNYTSPFVIRYNASSEINKDLKNFYIQTPEKSLSSIRNNFGIFKVYNKLDHFIANLYIEFIAPARYILIFIDDSVSNTEIRGSLNQNFFQSNQKIELVLKEVLSTLDFQLTTIPFKFPALIEQPKQTFNENDTIKFND